MTWGEIFSITAAPTITGLLALFQSKQNANKIREVHLTMNSRLDELLKSRESSAHAKGILEGRAQRETDQKP